jgi:hypothetical protein
MLLANSLVAAEPEPVKTPEAQPNPFVKELSADDRARLVQAVAGLESDSFELREKAQAELLAIGVSGIAELKKAHAATDDAEVKSRLGKVLETLDDAVDSFAAGQAKYLRILESAQDGNEEELAAAIARAERILASAEEMLPANERDQKMGLAQYDLAMALYRRFCATNSRLLMDAAERRANASVDRLGKYTEVHKDDKKAQDMLTEITMILYAIVKYKTL